MKGDKELVREKNRELRENNKSAKLEYKTKIKGKFFLGQCKASMKGTECDDGKEGKENKSHIFTDTLTSILGKCMERVIMKHLTNSVEDVLDLLQFAYKKARGTDDAVLTLHNSVAEHVQQTSYYARILFSFYVSF